MPRVVVEHGELLDATECFRCGERLDVRTKSFFTGEPIGEVCILKEQELKGMIENKGFKVEKFRNCGYMPDYKKNFAKK